jgi:hypothetical protein
VQPDDMPPPADDALRDELAGKGIILGDVIGLAPVPGSACDAYAASVLQMPDGTIVCRCVVCPRCGHHTGNSHQGHNWGYCKVTKTVRASHFCCGNEFGCELERSETAATG